MAVLKLKITKELEKRIDELVEFSNSRSPSDLVAKALALYEYCISAKRRGHKIIDETDVTRKEIEIK